MSKTKSSPILSATRNFLILKMSDFITVLGTFGIITELVNYRF